MNTRPIDAVILVVAIGIAWWAMVSKQNAERETVIALENQAALRDSVRTIRVGKARDSVAYVQSLQQRQVQLDGALRDVAQRERLVARLQARLTATARAVDSTVVDRPPVVDSSTGALVGRLDLQGPPITGHVTATLRPDTPSQWEVHLQPDPIPLTVTVGCRKDQPPAVVVVGPAWAPVQLGKENTLDPAICHPPPRDGFWGTVKKVGAGILIGVTVRSFFK